MKEIDRILTTKQAAAMLGISESAMKMRAQRRTLPVKVIKRHFQFKLADIVDLIDSTEHETPVELLSGNNQDELITLPQAATLLNMVKQTLWARFKVGIEPIPYGKVNGKWLFRLTDVIAAGGDLNRQEKFQCPVPPKQTQTPSKKDVRYGIEYETVMATCPKCRAKHEVEIVKGGSKWLYCPRHVVYRAARTSRFEPNGVNLPRMTEY